MSREVTSFLIIYLYTQKKEEEKRKEKARHTFPRGFYYHAFASLRLHQEMNASKTSDRFTHKRAHTK